jgi:hypothetical protein
MYPPPLLLLLRLLVLRSWLSHYSSFSPSSSSLLLGRAPPFLTVEVLLCQLHSSFSVYFWHRSSHSLLVQAVLQVLVVEAVPPLPLLVVQPLELHSSFSFEVHPRVAAPSSQAAVAAVLCLQQVEAGVAL